MSELCAFERELWVMPADLETLTYGFPDIAWAEFILNPRRLRGSDFLMRWSQGVWSEKRIAEAIDGTDGFRAIPYGPSGVAPENDPRQFELYFERLEKAGLGGLKRPDLLVIRAADQRQAASILARVGGPTELPFIPETDLGDLLGLALVAIECENSLWKAERMPAFGQPLRLQKRTGQVGAPKSAVLPTIILKEEDRSPLSRWESSTGIPIHIWHVFYDRAYGIALAEATRLIESGRIEPTKQVFQAPGGATTTKLIYKIYYQLAYPVGEGSSEPRLVADCIEDKNGHILPFVRFEGGGLQASIEAIDVLNRLARSR